MSMGPGNNWLVQFARPNCLVVCMAMECTLRDAGLTLGGHHRVARLGRMEVQVIVEEGSLSKY